MATDISTSAEEIQRQMQSVRSSLRAEVKELVENARDMTDWQYYVRRYPIASLAAAAAVGFLATSMSVSKPTKPPAGQPPSPVSDPPRASSPSLFNHLWGQASSVATSAISRAALGLLSQQVSRLVQEQLLHPASNAAHESEQHA